MNDAGQNTQQDDRGDYTDAPRFRVPVSAIIRGVLCLPLVCVSLLFAAIAITGLATLPAAERAALPGTFVLAAETAFLCLALASPAAAFRPSLLWLLPLAASASSGAAGWALLPLPPARWLQPVEGAVLLLPVMVLVMGYRWRLIPPGLAAVAAANGASPARAFYLAALRPALPGIAWGLAVVFVLALGLAPLLAPASGRP